MALTIIPASVYTDAGGDDMERKRNRNPEVAARAQAKYDAANTKQIHMKLNIVYDEDILSWLEYKKGIRKNNNVEGGIQGYIKDLIRQDMAREKGA